MRKIPQQIAVGHKAINYENKENKRMSNVAESEAEGLVPRIGSSSIEWKHFGFKARDTKQEQVICKVL